MGDFTNPLGEADSVQSGLGSNCVAEVLQKIAFGNAGWGCPKVDALAGVFGRAGLLASLCIHLQSLANAARKVKGGGEARRAIREDALEDERCVDAVEARKR